METEIISTPSFIASSNALRMVEPEQPSNEQAL